MSGRHPRHVVHNWRNSSLPFPEKVWLVMKNQSIKIAKRSGCCGNYGEPGC
jgi:hypothetical protein